MWEREVWILRVPDYLLLSKSLDLLAIGEVAHRLASIALQGYNIDCETQRDGFTHGAQQQQCQALQQDPWFASVQHLCSCSNAENTDIEIFRSQDS